MSAFSLALANLLHAPARTVVSLAGVAFAVLLVFMQLGFLFAVRLTATQLYDRLDFDAVIVSADYVSLSQAGTFGRERLAQAGAVPGVARARPLFASLGLWLDPRHAGDGDGVRRRHSVMVLGVEPSSLRDVFAPAFVRSEFGGDDRLDELSLLLQRRRTVLIDATSRPEYGPAMIGATTELNDAPVEVGGSVRVGTGFAYNGLVLASEETYGSVGYPDDRVAFGLIRVAPDADVGKVVADLRLALPEDVKVFARADLARAEQEYWLEATPVGLFFTFGVVIALVVGVIFVYQMMSADVARNIREYATVRAIGYPATFLAWVVVWQGLLLAAAGFLPGAAVSAAGYATVQRLAGITMTFTAFNVALVIVLTVAMCSASAALAVREVLRADPADNF